jgi:hypothetical protein
VNKYVLPAAMTILACAMTIYAWVVLPLYEFILQMFYRAEYEEREAGGREFSKVPKVRLTPFAL